MTEEKSNGSVAYMRDFHEKKFLELEEIIKDGFEASAKIMRDGFQLVASELRVTREQGFVPVPILQDILKSNNEAYKEMFKANNDAYKSLLRTVCYMLGGLMAWVTGMKLWLPN